MRIGNFQIGKYETQRASAITKGEVGASGTNIWKGYINEEFNS